MSPLRMLVTLEVLLMDGAERLRRRAGDDRGQTAAEYLGIIVVVAAIVAVLATTDIGDKIKTAITGQIDKIAK
jgi:pilus assembly protein Flp/PilA